MKKLLSAFIAAAIILIFPILPTYAADNLPAFPGAEGGGKYSPGARGASSVSVYHVTNLNTSGEGSFADAVSKPGRIIVFDVSGTIELSKQLSIASDNLTILGQTAPGDGITLTGANLSFENRKNLIIRYLRVRPTDKNGGEYDGLGGRWTNNVIIDHCSTSWSIDETLTLYAGSSESKTQGAHNTVQYTISSESLRMSNHFKGAHGYGGIVGATYSSWHHNLFAHHDSRSPRLDRELNGTDFRNNVIYDWGQTNSAYGGEPYSYNNVTQVPSYINWVNNYYKYGPGTAPKLRNRIIQPSAPKTSDSPKSNYYINGNYVFGYPSVTTNNLSGVEGSSNANMLSEAVSMTDDTTQIDYNLTETETAEDAYETVLSDVGATLPRRDAIDARIVADVKNQTGRIINKSEEVSGATATLSSESRTFEIPSNWKTANGMGSAAETAIVKSGKWAGYTWIEAYVNDWTEQQSAPTNPDITVLSPAVQTLSDTVNGYTVTNSAWAVITQDEPLNYKAVADAKDGTSITKIEIYDGESIIQTINDANADVNLTLSTGTHYLSSRAYNNKGEATQSPTSIVYVKSTNTAAQFTHTQIGTSGDFNNKGGAWYSGGTYTIMGSGKLTKDKNGTSGVSSDSCDFMYQEVTGDFDISVKIEQIPKFENGSVAGIMLRETLDPGSRMVMLADGWLKYGENVKAIVRSSSSATSQIQWFSGIINSDTYDTNKYPMPKHMRMQRSGDTITLSVSNSGTNWSDNDRKPMSITISDLPETICLGLAVDSICGIPCKEYMAEAKFSNLKLTDASSEPTASPEASNTPPAVFYNVNTSEDIQNGSITVSGTTSATVWEAAEHKSEISGKGTFNINSENNSAGTITTYADDTAVFTDPVSGSICIKSSNTNPSVNPPFSAANEPSGAAFKIYTPQSGTVKAEIYIYTGKKFNLYDNNNASYIMREEVFGSENVYPVEFDCEAGGEYYMWASGSKIGIKSVTTNAGDASGKQLAKASDMIIVNTLPDAGYVTDSVVIKPSCSVLKISSTEYIFTMPKSDVTINAIFKAESTPSPSPSAAPSASPSIAPSASPSAASSPSPSIAPSASPSIAPSASPIPEKECIMITATYNDDGILINIDFKKIKTSEIMPTHNTATNKTFYWESLENMKPINAEISD